MSPTALPGVSTPYTRIKNVLESTVFDKLSSFNGFQSSFGVFETDYTGPDISVWNDLPGSISRPLPTLSRQTQMLWSGNLGESPHHIESTIVGANIRKRQVFGEQGDYLEEESGLFGGTIARLLRASSLRVDGSELGSTSQFVLGSSATGMRNNHANGRLEFLVDGTTSRWHITPTGAFRPYPDATNDIGSSSYRVNNTYLSNNPIVTSDSREKEQQRVASEAEKRVALALKAGGQFFKWAAAVEKKGEDARWHYGWMAQEVVEVFASEGLDAHDYGMLCYDEWDDLPEIKDQTGEIVQEYRAEGNRYGVRMDQLLAFIVCNT